MDTDRASYIFRYFSELMTAEERAANRHLFATLKLMHGRSDAAAQAEARSRSHPITELISHDQQALSLASDGYETFVLRTAERIEAEHADKLTFNSCPRCGRLAKTPKAHQRRFCHHDWHSTVA
jgi:hypothetical protein